MPNQIMAKTVENMVLKYKLPVSELSSLLDVLMLAFKNHDISHASFTTALVRGFVLFYQQNKSVLNVQDPNTMSIVYNILSANRGTYPQSSDNSAAAGESCCRVMNQMLASLSSSAKVGANLTYAPLPAGTPPAAASSNLMPQVVGPASPATTAPSSPVAAPPPAPKSPQSATPVNPVPIMGSAPAQIKPPAPAAATVTAQVPVKSVGTQVPLPPMAQTPPLATPSPVTGAAPKAAASAGLATSPQPQPPTPPTGVKPAVA